MQMKSLHRVAALVAAAIVVLAGAARAEPVSPEPFFRHADYGEVRLSPSGRYLGALVPVRGRLVIGILDLDSGTSSIATGMDDRDVSTFHWVNDDRLVFSIVDLQSGLGEQRGGGLFAVNRDGTQFRVLGRTVKQMEDHGQFQYRYTRLNSTLSDGSNDVVVEANENNERYPDVYRLDTKTGRKTPLYGTKPGDVVDWVADRDGAVRACVAIEQGGNVTLFYYRASADAPWELVRKSALRESAWRPVAFDGDGTLIVSARVGRDTAALYPFDARSRSLGEPIAAHPKADLLGSGLVYDAGKKRIVGLAYDADKPGAAWFDDEWARMQATVDASLPGRRNVLSRGDKRSRVLVHSYSDTDPGSYYLYDPDKRRLEFVAAVRKAIDAAKMPSRTPVRYAARDGLEIPAYLTLPKGREAKNLPLVVHVHGGPFVRGNHWRWDAEAAWLAQGYAVLQPEFRGSRGWGRKHFEAGWKQWGRAMQDDLDDGVDWLAKQGTIDPKRVCIMGASYGGYAVMMGLARDPDRWRCGVNYVGVTDIRMMFDVTWSDFNYRYDDWKYSAREMIGDPDKDVELFKASSPLANAARIRAPVLMAYGGADYRVPIVHGERMRSALAARPNAADVEWIVYADEGHGFMQEKVRYDFYGRVAKFLDAQLAPH
jgi:dipeptidyl aminopeptidase/acylaminoacyl peptidase